jgi:hypothetical protein
VNSELCFGYVTLKYASLDLYTEMLLKCSKVVKEMSPTIYLVCVWDSLCIFYILP